MTALKAETIEIDGTSFSYMTHEDERWWTLRDFNVLRIPLKSNQFHDADKLGVRPQKVREGALKDWAKGTRAESGSHLLAWLDAVEATLAGEEPSGSIAEIQRAVNTDHQVRIQDAGQQTLLGYETIDWESFAYRGKDASGISLRALVAAGLYTRFNNAVRALKDSGLDFCSVESTGAHELGRPSEDHVLSLQDAQFFAMTARTETGEQIARCILAHHNDFQALLAGDEEVAERVELHQHAAEEVEHTQRPLTQIQILSQAAQALEDMEQEQLAAKREREIIGRRQTTMEQKLAFIEEAMDQQLKPGEFYASTLAKRAGWLTKNSNAHARAVHLIRELENCRQGDHYRIYKHFDEISGKVVDTYVYSALFFETFREIWREKYQGGEGQFYIENTHGAGAHVYAIKYLTKRGVA